MGGKGIDLGRIGKRGECDQNTLLKEVLKEFILEKYIPFIPFTLTRNGQN